MGRPKKAPSMLTIDVCAGAIEHARSGDVGVGNPSAAFFGDVQLTVGQSLNLVLWLLAFWWPRLVKSFLNSTCGSTTERRIKN
jgi:hypothetical protein